MEAERRHAYAVRLQCWWRGILAVRLKKRSRLALKETPLAVVQEEEEKAALVIQVKKYPWVIAPMGTTGQWTPPPPPDGECDKRRHSKAGSTYVTAVGRLDLSLGSA